MKIEVKKFEFGEDSDVLQIYENLREKNSVFLYSAAKGRYSIIGIKPLAKFEVLKNDETFKISIEGQNQEEIEVKNNVEVLDSLENFYQNFKNKFTDKEWRKLERDIPFKGGLFGFLSYEFGVKLENIQITTENDVLYPLVWFIVPTISIVFDHQNKKYWITIFYESEKRMLNLFNQIQNNIKLSKKEKSFVKVENLKSNLSLEGYIEKIARVKEYLTLGHSYQINFSQRFSADCEGDSYEVFKRLSKINPSPYQVYIEGEDFEIVSNSPERLVRVKGQDEEWMIESRPIKGTMPRYSDTVKDNLSKQALLDSKKDEAELVMIVDLIRNDLGKICKIGSVIVNEHRVLEKYANVWHTASNIRGILNKDKSFCDVIKALFPGGSITGCPKKRTMEIIDELEEFYRGVYTGSAGYISFDGNLDLNIMIRTMFFKNGKLYYHSGGGIVIDSDAEKEFEETIAKASSIKSAVKGIN